MSVTRSDFGGGTSLFVLETNGRRAAVTDFGAALVSLWHPDGTDLVLGFDNVAGYLNDRQFMGVIVGRYANRIANGRFGLSGQTWRLPCNEGSHHLHGGPDGFGRRVWNAEPDQENTAVRFRLLSPHLDQGYPGQISATVTYRLQADGRLRLTLEATSDRPSIVNLTPHGYFNLTGQADVLGHVMKLHAEYYTPVDDALIPTGEIRPVAGTPYDYRTVRPLSEILDTNFIIDGRAGELRPVAEVRHPPSGRSLSVCATMPGAQIYVGGGHSAGGYSGTNAGFCVEPQYFPDSPNHAGFQTPVVTPDCPYHEIVEYTPG